MTRATDRAARALDKRLEPLRLARPDRPASGWLRAIREALGMTTRQFAQRIGVSQPRVITLERAEVDGSVSLSTLKRAAEGLDCTLVYALVPRRPLTEMLRERAELKADQRLGRVSHTMQLENQGSEPDDQRRQREILIDALLRSNLRPLWDE